MPLRANERSKFTADQLAQLNRMDPVALDRMLDPPVEEGEPPRTTEEKTALRAKVVSTLSQRTVPQLRMRVNVTSGGNQKVIFSDECDYSADEQEAISNGWKANMGRKALNEMPAIIDDFNELKAELDADVTMTPRTKAAILKFLMKAR
jgi:hypothetical protein